MKIDLLKSRLPSRGVARQSLKPGLLCLAALALGVAQPASALVVGSGNVVTDKREVSAFHAVEATTFGNVVITQGDSEGLTVEGEDNLVALVKTEVDSKGTLHLDLKGNEPVRATKPLVFRLAVKTLDGLVLAGSGNVDAKVLNLTDKGNLDVVLRGSGNISVPALTVGGVKASVQGSGSLALAGGADHQEVTVAGSGDYDAGSLKSKVASVSVTGSGDVEVWATDKLKAEVTGSGDVGYYGKPAVEKKTTGSGSVDALGARGQ